MIDIIEHFTYNVFIILGVLLFRTAAQVLLATLAVPIQPIPSEIDRFLIVDTNTQGKSRRLGDLLRMQVPPTRAFLLQELVSELIHRVTGSC